MYNKAHIYQHQNNMNLNFVYDTTNFIFVRDFNSWKVNFESIWSKNNQNYTFK